MKTIDVLLFNPQKVCNLQEKKYLLIHKKFKIPKTRLHLPQGLLYISTLLDREGYKIKIINQDLNSDYKGILKKYIKKKPLCLGVTSNSGPQLKTTMAMLEYAKFIDPNLPVVIGGSHASLFPKWCLQKDTIDFVIPQEGEIPFYKLVKSLESGKKSFDKIKGLYLKSNDKIIFTGKGPIINLDKFPMLPYHLADIKGIMLANKKIFQANYNKKIGSLDYISSRGCSNQCTFCVIHRTKWRGLSPKRMLNDIIFLKQKYGVEYVKFTDDDFAADRKRIGEFSKLLLKEKIDIKWFIKLRIDSFSIFDERSIKLFKHAGLSSIEFGVESGSQRILNMLKKDINIKQILSANRKVVKHQLITYYTFLLNLPTETTEDLIKSFSLALELTKENPGAIFLFNKYAPYPGTELYKKFLKQFANLTDDVDTLCWKRMYNKPNINQKKIEHIILAFLMIRKYKILRPYLRKRLKTMLKRGRFSFLPEVSLCSAFKKNV